MTDVGHDQIRPTSAALGRAPEPKAAKYRRASIVGIAATAGLLLAFAFITGTLSTKRRGSDVQKSDESTRSLSETVEGLEKLPKTYSAAFSAQQPVDQGPSAGAIGEVAGAKPSSVMGLAPPAAAEPASPLFVAVTGTGRNGQKTTLDPSGVDPDPALLAGNPASSAGPARSETGPKLDGAGYHGPPDGFEVQAGDIIEGALLTALNSDLPGVALAQVTRDVFDHESGQTLLIPHGSRIFGHYDSRVGYGQNRASVLWERIIMPNGSSVDLKGMIGADDRGASGLAGSVDDHIGAIARAIGLSTALITGSAMAQNSGSRSTPNLVLNDAQGGVAAAASEVGGRFVERDLSRKPTIKVPAGWPVVIVVDKDLALRPYASASARSPGPGDAHVQGQDVWPE